MRSVLNYAKAVAASAWMQSIGGRGEFAALAQQTAFVVPEDLPDEVCRELVAKIDELAAVGEHPRVWRDSVASDTRVFGFEQDIPEQVHHFQIQRRIQAVDDYTGVKTRAWFLMANRVVPKEGNLGSGGGLHRDSPFSHQVKCIWYLNDVTSENGPFQYVRGTNVDLLARRDAYPLGKTRFDCVADELVEVTARAGTLLVCDTRCIHRGKPIEGGARYAVTLYTVPHRDGAEKLFRSAGLDPAHARPSSG